MDPLLVFQWHLDNDGLANEVGYSLKKKYADIGADAAWALVNGGAGIKIAILEDDLSVHPDTTVNIKPNTATTGGAMLIDGLVFQRDRDSLITTDPEFSHGTAVSGIAGSERNNSIGGVGVAYNAEIIPIQIALYDYDIALAISYAIEPNFLVPGASITDAADIINMSFGNDSRFSDSTSILKFATEKAILFGRNGRGVILIKSLSNANVNIDNIEKVVKSKYVFAVGRSGASDQPNGSPHGNELQFLVPGVDFVTNNNNTPTDRARSGRQIAGALLAALPPTQYYTGTLGTSWSAPVLSGIVALMLDANPNLTWIEVKAILIRTAHKIEIDHTWPNFRWKDFTGLDVVDNSQNLYPSGASTTLRNSIVVPALTTVRDFTIDVDDASNFTVGQTVMIGARTQLVSITNATIFIVSDATLFQAGHRITIGTNFSTSAEGTKINLKFWDKTHFNPPVLQNRLHVHTKRGFINGQTVRLTGAKSGTGVDSFENLTIQSVGSNDTEAITFNSNRVNDYVFNSCLEVLGKENGPSNNGLLILSISGNTITLDPSTPITDIPKHPTGTLVEIKGTEIAFVRDKDTTPGAHTLTINKLQENIAMPVLPVVIPITGGRIAYRTDYHGHGRIDAYQAVKEAQRLLTLTVANTPEQDLIIRDNTADTGLASSIGTIDSPDIAVSHSSSFPSVVGTVITHEEPLANKTRYVHIQVKNIGTEDCLDAEVRLFLRVVPASSVPSFDFPDNWRPYDIDNSVTPQIETPQMLKHVNSINDGVFQFDDIKEIKAGDIAGGATANFTFKWPKQHIPSFDGAYDTYLMAMVTPFDGLQSGAQVKDNNNISYKKVSIYANVLFKDTIGGSSLTQSEDLSAYSAPQTIPFAIEISNPVAFNLNNIEISIKQKNRKEDTEKVTFKYISGVWKFDGATPSWITFTTVPGASSGTSTNFEGTFKITPEQKYIELTVEAQDSASLPPTAFGAVHRTKVNVTDVSEIEDTSKGGAKMHFYTNVDAQLNAQVNTQAFGPFLDTSLPTKNLFRITNLHSATTTDPKAYSMCDGLVCAQEIDANHVNLIVKPFQQPALNFAPIKYIIYKGIKRTSLFAGSDIAPAGNNKLTQTIWDSHLQLKASIDNKIAEMTAAGLPPGSIPAPLPAMPSISALGLDLTTALDSTKYSDTHPIENLFLKADINFQYPIIRGGWDIGEFDKAGFGVEIVLENIAYRPTLAKVRVLENIITLDKLTGTETDIVKFEARLAYEEPLNYMDTAAFFGSLYSNRMFLINTPTANTSTGDFTQKSRNEVYDDLIKTKLFNKNRTFVDIRNEHSYSYNFYSNYDNSIKLGYNGTPAATVVNYYGNGYSWPLLIIENNEFSSTPITKANKFEIALPVSNVDNMGDFIENQFPLAYISQGYTDIVKGTVLKGANRFVTMTPVMEDGILKVNYPIETIKLEVPNGSTTANEVVASYIRIKYMKRFDSNITSTPHSSSGIVLRAQHYLDNLFVPVNMQIPYNSSNMLNAVVFDEEVYIDAQNSDVNFDCIAKIGLAEDANNNVTLFAFATDVRVRAKDLASSRFAISGESSDLDVDYLSQIANQNPNIVAQKDELTILSNAVPYISLLDTSTADPSFDKVDPDDFFSLLITKTQFADIVAMANDPSNFSQDFKVYLAIANKTNALDDNGIPYTTFDLVLRGHKKFSSDYQVVEVAVLPTITIYSNGNI